MLAASFDCLAKNFLGEASRINVGSVEKIDPGLEADGDQAGGFGHVARAPGAKEFGATDKCACAKTKCGYFQAGTAKLSKFHSAIDATRLEAMRILFWQDGQPVNPGGGALTGSFDSVMASRGEASAQDDHEILLGEAAPFTTHASWLW